MELSAPPLLLLLLLLLVSPPPCASDQPGPPKPPEPSRLQGSAPVVTGRPFVVVWNMPTAHCETLYGVQLNLGDFDIVVNSQQHFDGQNMTIFYRDRLGLYPFLSHDGARVNGGLPQSADLGAHLALAGGQFSRRLRPDFAGLAVIDWEEWRPLWARNFDSKKVYRRRSVKRVRETRPDLKGAKEVTGEAKREFEDGARRVMGETLRLGVTERPGGLWGYYGFPACYNDPQNKPRGANYTGECHPGTSRLNDRLDWLWSESTALYPSIYLPQRLAGAPESALMVRHRVLEALRVGSVWRHDNTSKATPVLPYARLAFAHTLDFLSVADLHHTLGEAAALGAAGVVLWGELEFARSKDQCVLLRDYLHGTLGRYVRKLRKRSHRCSQRRCHGNGRCARRRPGVGHMVRDETSGEHGQSLFAKHFLCHCYHGWGGHRCGESTK
ncbi:hyaluronidase-3 [Gadus macrocephalus]|uniref:hyaluronidase-3 n=1 Tax=Gadus macrocephalus TaxID=80720 RepID=UPI0028CBBB2B|nr:hyaluronidase-3 [Gadus macrocephalus]XP_059907776.1 hyaluronidase-3 [Gadus macrocephalus]